jgi:HK97 gp10 family phage protein
MPTTIRVEGLRELEARLKSLADEIGGKKAAQPVKAALRKAGKIVQKDAQARVRVDTGLLRDNIIVATAKRQKPGRFAVNVTVRAKAKKYADNRKNRKAGKVGKTFKNYGALYYARFLEFGTSKMQAKPFLRPAFEANKGQLAQVIRDELKLAIDKAVAKLRRLR